MTYEATRQRLETYFDRTAARTWETLTSDAPVSRVRQTVREGRDSMRQELLSILPADLTGARILDAGCGAGQMAVELAERGAQVVAVDISPSLLDVARRRTPDAVAGKIEYRTGDMLDRSLGRFNAAIAMDSLIHYGADDIARAVDGLVARIDTGALAFTVAPKTAILTAMWLAGKAFPRNDKSPAIQPHKTRDLEQALSRLGSPVRLTKHSCVSRGFYISQAMEARG